jgi:peptidyl-prolyl cis-trans isomerase A (cyclophilin A)
MMRVLPCIAVALLAGCANPVGGCRNSADVDVMLETELGAIEVTVYASQAPASAQAFLRLVDDGSFTRHGSFYRTVRGAQNDHGRPNIDVIQGGWADAPKSLPGVAHESTFQTGLRHQNGALSLARGALGSANGAEFFICIGAQPALDMGGGRDPFHDGQGFAAFGRVIRGMSIVRAIHALPTGSGGDPYVRGQMLDPPVRILKAYRVSRFGSFSD